MEINIWTSNDGLPSVSIRADTGTDGTPKEIAKAYKAIMEGLKEDK